MAETALTLRPHNRTLADQLLEYTSEKAKEIGLIDAQTLQRFHALQAQARDAEGVEDGEFKKLVMQAAEISPVQQLAMTQLLAAQAIVLNALSNKDNAKTMVAPLERFRNLFESGLKSEDPDAFITLLQQAKEQMLISIVQTMHPVIYHTPFAREKEGELTRQLEGVRTAIGRFAPISEEVGSAQLGAIKQTIDRLLEGMHQGEVVTPDTQVTVPQENKVELENFKAMIGAVERVVVAYNDALDKTLAGLDTIPGYRQSDGEVGLQRRLAINHCKLSPDNLVEFRTWARSADADGRKYSTSIELNRAIVSGMADGLYKGPKLDCRENAEVHRNFVSALIQKEYSEVREFQTFCNTFCEDAKPKGKKGAMGWDNPSNSILQQLSEDDQVDFLKRIIHSDNAFKLIPPNVKEITLEFNRQFQPLYKRFIEKHKPLIENKYPHLSPDEITMEHLREVRTLPSTLYPNGQRLSLALRQEVDANMKMSIEGRQFRFELDDNFAYNLHDYGISMEFLDRRLKLKAADNGDSAHAVEKVEIGSDERKKLMDVIKRLYMLDDAIDRYGNAVADRYQVANFEKASDFYGALLLFKEAGIIQVKDGEVVADPKPKLSLQPLLETAPDMRNARQMFSQLLDDPLVLSYYRALGNRAEIMLGFSDGAKSAGNLASEWNIYKCADELHALFAEKGIKLRVFQGRGRGPDRGGQFEEGHDQLMMPPSIQSDRVLDVTLQGDKPMDMQISKAAAEDTIASMIAGTLTAKARADESMQPKSEAEQASEKSMKEAIDFLAAKSEEEYCRLISRQKGQGGENEALKFLEGMPSNKLISSRKPKREGSAKADFDSTRAITVEYGFNVAHAPLHNIGFKTALETFIKEGRQVLDKDGKPVTGQEAIELLYDSHPFFRGMVDKTIRGMQNYKPAVFSSHAKAIGVEGWAKECIGELDGLSRELMRMRSKPGKNAQREPFVVTDGIITGGSIADQIQSKRQIEYSARESQQLETLRNMQSMMASALMVSRAVQGGEIQVRNKIFKPGASDAIGQDILRNSLFVTAQRLSHRGVPPELTAAVDGHGWVH